MAEVPGDEPGKDTAPIAKPADEKPIDTAKLNGHHAPQHRRTGSDPDAQEMVISSLRSQIQDLFSQVTELNNKLVKSYDRVSDLEDDLHVASSNIRSSSLKISQLELERTQHLSALNTGLLVEKSHVTSELTRLMEKATEEAAQRGQAESARADIEKDLDDLSATLFGQANSMVAEARYAQHLSERKVEEAERALKGAEEVVGMMQQQMQALQAEKEKAEEKAEEMQMVMGKGKWVERRVSSSSVTRSIRLLSSHIPYQEFLLFVAHLRTVHQSAPHPPAMTTLLPLPFLVRLLNEDSEPTIRLDQAPSLNWLSRRSVLAAIHNGQLTIEPMSSSILLQESHSASNNIPGLNSSSNNISCALCGAPIFSTPEAQSHLHAPSMTHSTSNSMSWPTALFKKPSQTASFPNSANSQPPTPPRSTHLTTRQSDPRQLDPPQIHIFRLAASNMTTPSIPIPPMTRTISSAASSSAPPHHPDITPSNYGTPSPQPTTIYPLCANSWCLARLRSTCILWAFVRSGIVEKIWEEEIPNLPPPASITPTTGSEKPPVPPRRRGLWGMASALGERAAIWGEGDKDKAKKVPSPATPAPTISQAKEKEKGERRLPPPPPSHPNVAATHTGIKHPVPPPLPRRSEIRRQPSPPITDGAHGPSVVDGSNATTTNVDPPFAVHPPLPTRSRHRPNTPSNVPLPDSRPSTPVNHPIPSTTASPIPPPLPRRAATRVRTTVDGSSRPATPAPIPEVAGGASETKTTDSTTQDAAPKIDDPPKSEPNTPRTDAPVKEVEIVGDKGVDMAKSTLAVNTGDKPSQTELEVESPSTSAPEDVFVDAETDPGPSVKHTEASNDVIVKETAVVVGADEAPMEDKEPAKAMEPTKNVSGGDAGLVDDPVKDDETAKGENGQDVSNDGETIPKVDTTPANGTEDTADLKEDQENQENQVEGDKEVYIGDATWEERTWKELVRLREDMFWARVGALRP